MFNVLNVVSAGPQLWLDLLLPAGLGSHHRVGHLGLPPGHPQEEDDDDRGPVQGTQVAVVLLDICFIYYKQCQIFLCSIKYFRQ